MIQRRDNAKWEPPGGILEVGESVIDGLRREVREETGLLVDPDRLTGVYKNMTRGVLALVFSARVIGGALLSSTDETRTAQWLTWCQVNDLADEACAVRVRDALSLAATAVRTHDGVALLHGFAGLPADGR
jgi:ADP-ribose pyrophosphatase YjhB (NUDIX family)